MDFYINKDLQFKVKYSGTTLNYVSSKVDLLQNNKSIAEDSLNGTIFQCSKHPK